MKIFTLLISLSSLIAASVGAYYWYKSATVAVPAPEDTRGVGALLGGYLVSMSEGKRIDLHATLFWQNKYNKKAALWTAAGIVLNAFPSVLSAVST